MIRVRVRNKNNVNLAKSPVRSSSYCVSRIVQESHSCRIFKKNCAILCAKLAGTLSDRRDLNVLAERDGRSADQCHHDVESLPSLFHSRSSMNPLGSSKRNVRLSEFENYGLGLGSESSRDVQCGNYDSHAERESRALLRSTRGPWGLRNSQPMGCCLRPPARRPWFPGIGNVQRCCGMRHW